MFFALKIVIFLDLSKKVTKGEDVTFVKVVKAFYTKCIKMKVPVKSLDFMVKIVPNVSQLEQKLKTPMKPFIREDKMKGISDKMTHLRQKLDTESYNFIESSIGSITFQQIAIEKLNNKILTALEFKMHNEDFKKEFYRWTIEKLTKIDRLRDVEKNVDSMYLWYSHFRATFQKEMSEAEKVKTNIRHSMDSAKVAFDKFDMSEAMATELKLHLSTVTEHLAKLLEHLKIVNEIVNDYNAQRIEWAEYLIGLKDSIEVS